MSTTPRQQQKLSYKWFARFDTPDRMQYDNATNFTEDIAQEPMKASQVTKVSLLTLYIVYASPRIMVLDWEKHIDGVF